MEEKIVCTGEKIVDMSIMDYDILTAMREHDIELTEKNFEKCKYFIYEQFTNNYIDEMIYRIVDSEMDDYYDDEEACE